jgi:hypothetical protein
MCAPIGSIRRWLPSPFEAGTLDKCVWRYREVSPTSWRAVWAQIKDDAGGGLSPMIWANSISIDEIPNLVYVHPSINRDYRDWTKEPNQNWIDDLFWPALCRGTSLVVNGGSDGAGSDGEWWNGVSEMWTGMKVLGNPKPGMTGG